VIKGPKMGVTRVLKDTGVWGVNYGFGHFGDIDRF
jgi:hypothetical protein